MVMHMQQANDAVPVKQAKPAPAKPSLLSPPAKRMFTPILASLLRDRWTALLLVGIAGLQVGLVALGLPGWICPIKATLGVPCPGCGLSTAMVLLLRGEWRAALATHAFAPVFLLGFALLVVVSLLPERLRQPVVRWIGTVEQRTGIVLLLLLSLVAYWGFRLFGLS